MNHFQNHRLITVYVLCMGMVSLVLYACGDDTVNVVAENRINYGKAAEREYATLLDAWFCQKERHPAMWYQGDALDTLIDYVSITQDREKGSELGGMIPELWKVASPEGLWWDDFGWWGMAFLNAARNYGILGQPDATEYMGQAASMLGDRMDYATEVWNQALTSECLLEPPEDWSRYAPRFDEGVWNSAFAGLNTGKQWKCNPNDHQEQPPIFPDLPVPVGTPGDYCSTLNPLQNTVTDGLYLVLNTRYVMQNPQAGGNRRDKTVGIYEWFKSWMDVEDEAITLCFGNQIKPSLLNAETGLVRERAGTYAKDTAQSPHCFQGVKWYEPELAWAGDQGIVLGGLVDIMNSGLAQDDAWLIDKAKGILDGVKDHMTRKMSKSTRDNLAPGMLRPWTRFDGWGPEDPGNNLFTAPGGFGFGDPDYPLPGTPEYEASCSDKSLKIPLDTSANYVAGPGIFMRYLLYVYRNNKDLRDHIRSEEYLGFLKTNADVIAKGQYSCSCKNDIDSAKCQGVDSGTYDICNLSCQITRLATLNMAISILAPREAYGGMIPFMDFYRDNQSSETPAEGCGELVDHNGTRGIQMSKGCKLRAYNVDFSTGGRPLKIEISGTTPNTSGAAPGGRLDVYINNMHVSETPITDLDKDDVLSGNVTVPASLILGPGMTLDIRAEDTLIDPDWKMVITGVRFGYSY